MDYNDLQKELSLRQRLLANMRNLRGKTACRFSHPDVLGIDATHSGNSGGDYYGAFLFTGSHSRINYEKNAELDRQATEIISKAFIYTLGKMKEDILITIIKNMEDQLESVAIAGAKQAQDILDLIKNKDKLKPKEVKPKTGRKIKIK